MRMRQRVGRVASGVALCLAAAGAARGQGCLTGHLHVLVQDATGKPVPGASVTVGTEPATSHVTSQVTSQDGIAEFSNLACGARNASVVKPGFQDLHESFQVSEKSSAELSLTLAEVPVVRDSVEVHDTTPTLEQSASPTQQLKLDDVKNLPSRPANVADTLPLVPGIVRSADGEIKIDGEGEHRSAFTVNSADVTDPATGKFGLTVPIDGVETVDVLNMPFLAQYGNFTSGVVAVETNVAAIPCTPS